MSSSASLLPEPIEGVPRVFLSYSWDGPEHKEWVWRLAERLQHEGIQVLLDRWHLRPGEDKTHFMEQAVSQSDFVIIICTPPYADRANNRQGGVGYESAIVTSEFAGNILSAKFVPVLRLGTYGNALPIYLKSRLGVNLCGDPYSEGEYDNLLRKLHTESIKAPPLGEKPNFSNRSETYGQSDEKRGHREPPEEDFGVPLFGEARTIAEEMFLLCVNPKNPKIFPSIDNYVPLALVAELVFLKRIKLVDQSPSTAKLYLEVLNSTPVQELLLDRVLSLIVAQAPTGHPLDLPKALNTLIDADTYVAYLKSRRILGDDVRGFFSNRREFLAHREQLTVRDSFLRSVTSGKLSYRMAIVGALATIATCCENPVDRANSTWQKVWKDAQRLAFAQCETVKHLSAVHDARLSMSSDYDGYINVN